MSNRGMVFWMTGLSAAGKTTISKLVKERCDGWSHNPLEVIDGDIIRNIMGPSLGFSKEDRLTQANRLAYIAELLSRNGVNVIVSTISPYKEGRDKARELIGAENFKLIYVKCDIEICKERDPKGLYKQVDAGKIKNFTGIDDPYEAPVEPDFMIASHIISVDKCGDRLYDYIVDWVSDARE